MRSFSHESCRKGSGHADKYSRLIDGSLACLYNQRLILTFQETKSLRLTSNSNHTFTQRTTSTPSQPPLHSHKAVKMSFTRNVNNFGGMDSPRTLDHDGVEDNGSVAGRVTDSDIPPFSIRAGSGYVEKLPVRLAVFTGHLILSANDCHPRCRVSDAHVARRGVSSSGCSPASIALVAISPARL